MTVNNKNPAQPGMVAVALLVLAWWAATACLRPLMLPDEGRYVGIAWEMLRSGDWLTPTINGLPYFHKPPLFYWITASSLWLFGNHEGAARVAPMLGALAGSWASYAFLRRWWSERAGRMGLLVLMAQPLWIMGAQFANLDTLVAGCIVATICLLAHAVMLAEHALPHRRVLLAAWGMAALGVLAKGLIGFVLPALVVFLWLVAQRRWRRLGGLFWWAGPLLFLCLTAPWFFAMQQRFPDFLYYFFVVQHFKRFAEAGFNNVMPIWFYPAALALFFLPWLPWMARACRPLGSGASPEHRSVRLLLWIWAAVIVGFFSLPKSKLLGYVMPAVVPLAALAAQGYLSRERVSRLQSGLWFLAAGTGTALALGALTWLTVHPQNSMRAFAQALSESRQAAEPVVMLDTYYFDLPFYAGLRTPVAVIENWDDPAIQQRDDQRKEIADAGQFDRAAASVRLLLPASLPRLLCRSGVVWVLGPSRAVERYPYLAEAASAYSRNAMTLWRLETGRPAVAAQLGCSQMPYDDALRQSPAPLSEARVPG
ncbi:ArnT family glycosyltransferase [Paracidovorax wautersii]|uniref:Dolichyl-phosphate-mannose-protein mannosyltransferase n=1 Tax=Paracidovorax wautersii TaxID=1177982 RepID=A0A1I2EFI6_9BURK|nr:glycosyltransferase family 39 protein [Paracidovorax wautersii]SFE91020.1 Dolichyl-phosphate-mannose-protein mannosyltransferase [Paracidovorax wautersii]